MTTTTVEQVAEKPQTWQEYMLQEIWPRLEEYKAMLLAELPPQKEDPDWVRLKEIWQQMKDVEEEIRTSLDSGGRYGIRGKLAGYSIVHVLGNAIGNIGSVVVSPPKPQNKQWAIDLLNNILTSTGPLVDRSTFIQCFQAKIEQDRGGEKLGGALVHGLEAVLRQGRLDFHVPLDCDPGLAQEEIEWQGEIILAVQELCQNALHWLNERYKDEEGFVPNMSVKVDAAPDPYDFRNRIKHLTLLTIPSSRPSIRISVIDNGPGIDPSIRGHLFEPGKSTRTGRVQMGGMGLAAVSELAQELGGTIRVEDTPGGGATFILTIPYQPITKPTA